MASDAEHAHVFAEGVADGTMRVDDDAVKVVIGWWCEGRFPGHVAASLIAPVLDPLRRLDLNLKCPVITTDCTDSAPVVTIPAGYETSGPLVSTADVVSVVRAWVRHQGVEAKRVVIVVTLAEADDSPIAMLEIPIPN